MIPVVGAFRGLFLGSVLVWYSSSVWKTMDSYYNQEFKKYLQKEKEAAPRRLPAGEEVCRTPPVAPVAPDAPGSHGLHPSAPPSPAEASCAHAVEEALAEDAAPESVPGGGGDGSGGGGGGGGTVGSDVTHPGEWRSPSAHSQSGDGSDASVAVGGEEDGACRKLLTDDDEGPCPGPPTK